MLSQSKSSRGSEKCIVDTEDRREWREICQWQPTALIKPKRASTRQSFLVERRIKNENALLCGGGKRGLFSAYISIDFHSSISENWEIGIGTLVNAFLSCFECTFQLHSYGDYVSNRNVFQWNFIGKFNMMW